MATKKDLEARIAALEAEVALLRARPVVSPIVTGPYYPYPAAPFTPQIWCGANTSSGIQGTTSFNAVPA